MSGKERQSEWDQVAERLAEGLSRRVPAGQTGSVESIERLAVALTAGVQSSSSRGTSVPGSNATGGSSASGQVETPVSSGPNLNGLKEVASTLGLLSPIVTGLLRLFVGSKDQEVTAPAKFNLPAPARFQGGIARAEGWEWERVDRGAGGGLRAIPSQAAQQVIVQVQAMDSKSFLDHRDEIASAVRRALLESHGLGDVVREV